MDRAEVAKLFMIINYTYPTFTVDETKIHVWHEVLSDFPFDVAQQNLRRHIKTEKFAPTVAEIRHTPEPEGTYIPNAEETRLMLESRMTVTEPDGTVRRLQPVPPPPHLRELVKSLGIGKP